MLIHPVFWKSRLGRGFASLKVAHIEDVSILKFTFLKAILFLLPFPPLAVGEGNEGSVFPVVSKVLTAVVSVYSFMV